jgi:hypothetical protein
MKQYNNAVSREEVLALLCYDPVTGLFTHRVKGHRRAVGQVTGRLDTKGYVRIRLLGYEFKAHRLAWLITYGCWPNAEIDHINGCPSDNRIMNLRDVSVAENGWNRKKAMRNNKSGLLGVALVAGRYHARIRANGESKHLGVFDSAEAAHAAYLNAKAVLHQISP